MKNAIIVEAEVGAVEAEVGAEVKPLYLQSLGMITRTTTWMKYMKMLQELKERKVRTFI